MFAELEQILLAFLAFLLLVILSVLVATIYRRAAALRRYRILDLNRERYGKRFRELIDEGKSVDEFSAFVFPSRSAEWHAVEHVLFGLIADRRYESAGAALFDKLGYRSQYERKLENRNIIAKSSAVEKLGRMRCEASTGKLVPLLDEKSGEIVPVTVRALSKIGTQEALRGVLDRLPDLYSRSFVSRKSIESSLRNFGPAAVPDLVRYGDLYIDPVSRASVLEVLGVLGPPEALPFAFRNLHHEDSEVRAKALKVIAAAGGGLPPGEKERVVALLGDPVWFVRLQAAKALGILRHDKAEAVLAKRLLDANWQVRNAAATALVLTSGNAIGIFLDTLGASDRYAKESICEEIQKTGFVSRLIDNLVSPGGETYGKSREILKIMASLGYGTPLREYLESGADDRARRELTLIVQERAAS
ncbi:HEAT repeat domain-containing protein [Candidatus Deferrimicrobium sp.]|uniref:HEAT repeat domain-containing protein n=1 Tax=Candidatus Deferrimicrobium sp. TaxID=3060586 RepID=UPI002EDB7CA6